MNIEIKWTNDCQGKKSYDANIVELSSRYWPRGGGFWLLTGGSLQQNDARPYFRPCATSTLYLGSEVLAKKKFEGETEKEGEALRNGSHSKLKN